MSDIFREVDEDLRREQFKKIWDRVGIYVIGLAVLIVAVTAGVRGWQYWQERQAQASGDRFVAAVELATSGKSEEAQAAFAEIVKDGSGGYPTLSRFRMAGAKAEAGDAAGAAADLDAIAADGSAPQLIRDFARIRAALLLADTATLDELKTRIGSLADPLNVWRSSAREILGLAAWRTGDLSTAQTYFDEIAKDNEASQGVKGRAQVMIGLIRAKLGTPAAAEPAKPAG
jgi:hypothetical protein